MYKQLEKSKEKPEEEELSRMVARTGGYTIFIFYLGDGF
jgi:hypothetical protein